MESDRISALAAKASYPSVHGAPQLPHDEDSDRRLGDILRELDRTAKTEPIAFSASNTSSSPVSAIGVRPKPSTSRLGPRQSKPNVQMSPEAFQLMSGIIFQNLLLHRRIHY